MDRVVDKRNVKLNVDCVVNGDFVVGVLVEDEVEDALMLLIPTEFSSPTCHSTTEVAAHRERIVILDERKDDFVHEVSNIGDGTGRTEGRWD